MALGRLRLLTPRLILRPPAAEDFEAWAAFAAEPRVMAFLGGVQSRAVAWRAFGLMAGSWALCGFGMFSVLERTTGRWLGRVGPWRPEGWPGNEIGWGLLPDAQGQGYAFEAAEAAIDWATSQLQWTSFIHCIDAGNARSIALAERLGSAWLGERALPDPIGRSVGVYGQSAVDWERRRGQRPR